MIDPLSPLFMASFPIILRKFMRILGSLSLPGDRRDMWRPLQWSFLVGTVAVIERYYAKYDSKSAAKQLLRLIEGGKVKTGTKTGTWGE
jgi:hypothetical protein